MIYIHYTQTVLVLVIARHFFITVKLQYLVAIKFCDSHLSIILSLFNFAILVHPGPTLYKLLMFAIIFVH